MLSQSLGKPSGRKTSAENPGPSRQPVVKANQSQSNQFNGSLVSELEPEEADGSDESFRELDSSQDSSSHLTELTRAALVDGSEGMDGEVQLEQQQSIEQF